MIHVRSLSLSQTSLKERIDFLRLGKNYIQPEVMCQNDRQILYRTRHEELAKELSIMEIKDQELAAACVDVGQFYKELDVAAP